MSTLEHALLTAPPLLAFHSQLDLSWNQIDAEAAKPLADALRVNTSLTEVDLRQNKFGTEGWCSIFDALAKSTTSKITKWDLFSEQIGPQVAKSLAAYLAVSTSLTSLE